jgi:hypothetical protein
MHRVLRRIRSVRDFAQPGAKCFTGHAKHCPKLGIFDVDAITQFIQRVIVFVSIQKKQEAVLRVNYEFHVSRFLLVRPTYSGLVTAPTPSRNQAAECQNGKGGTTNARAASHDRSRHKQTERQRRPLQGMSWPARINGATALLVSSSRLLVVARLAYPDSLRVEAIGTGGSNSSN